MTDIRAKNLTLYAQFAFPLAFAGLPLYIHAPDFYATEFGVSLGFIGIALLLVRLFDAVTDPLIGLLSDRFSTRRLSIVTVAGIIFAASFAALFNPPPALEPLWFVASVFTATLSFSVLAINFNSLGSLWAQELAEKTRISATREAFGVAGLMTAILLPYLVADMRTYASIVAVAALCSLAVFAVWLARYLASAEVPAAGRSLPAISACLRGETGVFFGIYALGMLASSMPAVLVLFYVRDYLDAGAATGFFLALYFLAAIVAMPLWRKIASRTSSRLAWTAAMALSACSLIWAGFIAPQSVAAYAAICLFSGFALGGELLLPPAILSALIDRRQARESTAAYFGLYAFFMKLSLAVASVTCFLTLDLAGFRAAAENTDDALRVLVLCYAVVPSLLKALAALLSYKYGEKNETELYRLPVGGRHDA